MKQLLLILPFVVFSTWAIAQDDMAVIDSLENVLVTQQGTERIETMIQLVSAFYDVSFDDGIEWGEKSVRLAREMNATELEADALYALGVQYGYHNDLDLSQDYLKQSYHLYEQVGNEAKAFEALWSQAYFELILGNMDTAYVVFQNARSMAERLHDSLACAQTCFNMAVIQYQRNNINEAISDFLSSKALYGILNDTASVMNSDLNLATLYGECGKYEEARELFKRLIPWYEANNGYEQLLYAYKNYGLLFERDLINYDSANYYFEKALSVIELSDVSRAERQTMANSKADVLTELGNVAMSQNQLQKALAYYQEALSLAESYGYHFGHMQTMLSLGQLYAQMGQAAQSLYYLERYSEEASSSGITLMEYAVKKSLILDYARLGRYDEMKKELDNLDEQRLSLTRENADVLDQIRELNDEVCDLVKRYESQNEQIETLKAQRNQYRLAFFGLLAIALFTVVLFVAYKIVSKKRSKIEKG